MSWDNERAVRCPKCGAKKGKQCVTRTGNVCHPHNLRIIVANSERHSNNYLKRTRMLFSFKHELLEMQRNIQRIVDAIHKEEL